MSLSEIINAPLPPRPTLTEEQKRVIKSSADALAPDVFGTKITALMYANMLNDNKELNDVFSYSKQTTGKQPLALAQSVHAYATHIFDLTPILPVVERIANKHASLHIEPWQYAVVAKYLMAALTTVLGEAFTPELQDAWAAGYWALAYVFIDAERALYQTAGWEGWKTFVVDKRVDESEDVTSFYLKPKDGSLLKPYHPGQYISIKLFVDNLGFKQSRQYSLSDTPNPNYFRISVKRESGTVKDANSGERHPTIVSRILHSSKNAGSEVEVSFPFGEFFLDEKSSSQTPVVLLSAGIGLTPLLSMLNTIVGPQNIDSASNIVRPVTWLQGLHSPSQHPFINHVHELSEKYPRQLKTAFFYSALPDGKPAASNEYKGHLNITQYLQSRPLSLHDSLSFTSPENIHAAPVMLHLNDKSTTYYVCGPEGFMADVRRDLVAAGVDNERILEELFVAS